MLHSTLAPEHSMTAYSGAGPAHGLALALMWWPVALVLALAYLTVLMRTHRGKVTPAEDPLTASCDPRLTTGSDAREGPA